MWNILRRRQYPVDIRGGITKYITSTVQLHDSLGSRRACACSEAGFSNQNGGRD
jgi:hypothetical protein